MRRRRWLLLAPLALLAAGVYLARSAWADGEPESADGKAVVQTLEAMASAYNKADAKALAALWSPTGVYLSHESGERLTGRASIEKEFAAQFARAKGARLEMAVVAFRLVTPEVAAVDGTARVLKPREFPSDSTFIMMLVKKKDQWLVDSVRETELPAAESGYENLKELEWMIGDWVDSDDDVDVTMTCEWVANGNFLSRRYTVTRKKDVELEGTQIVGWDSVQKKIRSWNFDSDGSFAEGTWRRDGNRWTVRASGFVPGGKRAAATQIITKVDDSKYTYQAVSRTVDGQMLPNIDPVTMVRKAGKDAVKEKEQRP